MRFFVSGASIYLFYELLSCIVLFLLWLYGCAKTKIGRKLFSFLPTCVEFNFRLLLVLVLYFLNVSIDGCYCRDVYNVANGTFEVGEVDRFV